MGECKGHVICTVCGDLFEGGHAGITQMERELAEAQADIENYKHGEKSLIEAGKELGVEIAELEGKLAEAQAEVARLRALLEGANGCLEAARAEGARAALQIVTDLELQEGNAAEGADGDEFERRIHGEALLHSVAAAIRALGEESQ